MNKKGIFDMHLSNVLRLSIQPSKALLFRAVLFGLIVVNTPAVTAAGFNILPMRLDMSARTRNSSIEITNLNDSDVPIQMKAYEWTQQDGKRVLTPTRDIFLAPPITNVKASSKQIVRFRLKKGADLDKEKSYRIFVEQIPPGDPALRAAMAFRLRFSLPLFVAPNRYSDPSFNVTASRVEGGVSVVLNNTGNIHVKVDKAEAFRGDADKEDLQPTDHLGSSGLAISGTGYVLQGSRQEWFIPLTPEALSNKSLRVAMSTDYYNASGNGRVERNGVIWIPVDGTPRNSDTQ